MIMKNQSLLNGPKCTLPSLTLSKKFAIVDWCYRRISPIYIYTERWPGAASRPWRPPYREAPL